MKWVRGVFLGLTSSRLRWDLKAALIVTAILVGCAIPCSSQASPAPGEILEGALTGTWYLPLATPGLVDGPAAGWPGSVAGPRDSGLFLSFEAWAPEGTRGVSWSRGLELIRGGGSGAGSEHDFLAGIIRAYGVDGLAIPGLSEVRFGLTRAETGFARGWSSGGTQAGEIRFFGSWVTSLRAPVGPAVASARLHIIRGTLESRYGGPDESTTLNASGRGYALDVGVIAPVDLVDSGAIQGITAGVFLANVLSGVTWDGSVKSASATRPYSRYERAPTGTALSVELRPALEAVRSIRVALESSGEGTQWNDAGAPDASPWRLRLGAQAGLAPGVAGTVSVALYPDRGPSAAAGASFTLGRMTTEIALAFDDRLSVASRVMVTECIRF